MKYIYQNITSTPNINHYDYKGEMDSGILFDIVNSTMTDKNVNCISYQQNLNELWVFFVNDLSLNDKTKLDTIINNNPTYIQPVQIVSNETFDPVKPSGEKVKIGVDEDGILYTEEI